MVEQFASLQGEIAELDQSPADDRAWQRGTARCGRLEGHGQSPGAEPVVGRETSSLVQKVG